MQLAQTVYHGREYEKKKERQRKTKEEAEALAMAVGTVLKELEKNAPRDPGGKGWACYYCGKEGHLKRDCPQESKLSLLYVRSAKAHTGRETAPRGIGFKVRTLKTIRTEGARRSPHKLPS